MDTIDAINRLSSLDLAQCADGEIRELLNMVTRLVVPAIKLGPGHCFYRATVLDIKEQVSIGRMSYKPRHLNKVYQRASIPGETMFYATFPNIQDKNYNEGAASALFECAPCFRGKITDGEYRMAVCEWRNRESITLMMLTNPQFDNKSPRMNDSAHCFNQLVREVDDARNLMMFQKFMSEQFTKHVEVGHDYNYRISALFVENLQRNMTRAGKKIDGVVWQSAVNVDEKLNDVLSVAIYPSTIDSSFCKPSEYYEYKVQIKNGQALPIIPLKHTFIE